MTKTIAIFGAGTGLGTSVARRFGRDPSVGEGDPGAFRTYRCDRVCTNLYSAIHSSNASNHV